MHCRDRASLSAEFPFGWAPLTGYRNRLRRWIKQQYSHRELHYIISTRGPSPFAILHPVGSFSVAFIIHIRFILDIDPSSECFFGLPNHGLSVLAQARQTLVLCSFSLSDPFLKQLYVWSCRCDETAVYSTITGWRCCERLRSLVSSAGGMRSRSRRRV